MVSPNGDEALVDVLVVGQYRDHGDRGLAIVVELFGRAAEGVGFQLHDVIAHSLSVMTVGAPRVSLSANPDGAREALRAVAETGRGALAEMRRLLGLLPPRPGEPALVPQPGLGDLETLVDRGRAAGLGVELTVEGPRRALSPGADLAAYRIVQEALTNARRHAGPTRTRVTISFGAELLRLEVCDEGGGPARAAGNAGGHGLVGMRERVALYGGQLEAGRDRRAATP